MNAYEYGFKQGFEKQSGNFWTGLKSLFGGLTPQQYKKLRNKKHWVSYLPWNNPRQTTAALQKPKTQRAPYKP